MTPAAPGDDVLILGAHGKLGKMLSTYAKRSGLGWRTQARHAPADVIWTGEQDAPQVFQQGATLINMIGATTGDAAHFSKTNVEFVRTLLTRAARAGVAHVILASSAAIYGKGGQRPRHEGDTPTPITPYAHSKCAMESIARQFSTASTSDLRITVLRIANVAGADAFLGAAETCATQGKTMPLHCFAKDRAAMRSYIGPEDLFSTVKALIETKHPLRDFNVTHPQPVTLDALARAYKDQLLPDLTWENAAAPKSVPANVTLSADKVTHYVPFTLHADPAHALAAQVAHYRTL